MPANTSAEAIGAAISERRAVLFCGAGISVDPPATLPDWKTLRDETIKAVASSEASLAGMLPALLAQDVSRAAGQGLAPELVATTISAVVPGYFTSLRVLDHDTPNRNHALIARLARGGFARYVVSTNFDQLIERALTNEGVEFRVVRSDAEFAAFDSAALFGAGVDPSQQSAHWNCRTNNFIFRKIILRVAGIHADVYNVAAATCSKDRKIRGLRYHACVCNISA